MVSRETRTADEVLADEMAGFFSDPLGYVMFCFPWDTETSIQVVKLAEGVESELTADDRKRQKAYRKRFTGCTYGPDLWACDKLTEIGGEIKKRGFDGSAPVDPLYFATVSGHEIGKSALVAWLIKFILDTRPLSKGSVTAVTDEQLRTKTWAELGKWHAISVTEHWFKYTSSRGNMTLGHVNPKYSGSWRCDARTCRKEKSEAFAGQHAPMATSFYIFDEASGIPDKIFEVREGGLSSGEPMVFDFGNGTVSSGAFYEECAGRLQGRYIVSCIDSRTVAITNKNKIQNDVEQYGEDSDFIRVRWRGMFPSQATTQFIPSEAVELAMERELVDDPLAPVVIGVDVARFGNDHSVIYSRRGADARSRPPQRYHGLTTVQLVARVGDEFRYWQSLGKRPHMIFVDGTGLGAGVVDQLRALGYPVTDVNFGSKPAMAPDKYRFRVDEMWGGIKECIGNLCLPSRDTEDGLRLFEDLTQRQFGYTIAGQKVALESKDEMKKRGLRSPDDADALALTYAMTVIMPVQGVGPGTGPGGTDDTYDFDPHADLRA